MRWRTGKKRSEYWQLWIIPKPPISWHCIDEEDLILAIVRELNRIDKEETAGVG